MYTAEEYNGIYRNSYRKEEAIRKICMLFLQETGLELGKIPVPSDVPVQKIREVLMRQNEKWQKFAALCDMVRPDDYEILLQREASGLYSVLKDGDGVFV